MSVSAPTTVPRRLRCVAAVIAGACAVFVGGWPGPGARAQRTRPTVAIMGLTASQTGAEALAFDLTGTLRWEARRVRDWLVVPKELDPVAQRRAHRCGDLDDVCLISIARGLDVDGLVYGHVSLTRGSRYSVALGYFDRRRGRTTRSVTDTFPVVAGDIDALRPRVRSYLTTLTGRGGRLPTSSTAPRGRAGGGGEAATAL